MAVSIGSKSGCLEVIATGKALSEEVRTLFHDKAESLWKREPKESDLLEREYKLTKREIAAYLQGKEMPSSFIDKFILNRFEVP